MCVPCRDGLLCPWAAARPQSTAHDLPGSAWSLCVPVGGGPPARSPHASLTARSGRSRGPPWPCRHPPAPRPCPPPPTHTTARPPAPSTPASPISHAIPPRSFQILKSDRWNYNVFRLYLIFTQSNCMRLLRKARPRPRPRAPQPLPVSRVRPVPPAPSTQALSGLHQCCT